MITCFEMPAKNQPSPLRLLGAIFGTLLFVSGCGKDESSEVLLSQTECSGKTAQIQVMDGFLKRLCGCTETSNTLIDSPNGQTLNCTVSTGTIVHFHFNSTRVQHQIVPSGSQAIPISPLTQSEGLLVTPSFAVPFDAAGSYPFQDRFNSKMSGTITVL
jgi:hypothetical protein